MRFKKYGDFQSSDRRLFKIHHDIFNELRALIDKQPMGQIAFLFSSSG